MFVHLVTFNLGKKYKDNAISFRNAFIQVFQDTDGFVSADFFRNDDLNEVGGFTVWESEEAANAALETLQPLLDRTISGSGDRTFSIKKFEHTIRIEK